MGQDVSEAPSISIGDYTLEVIEDFTYLGSTISSNLSLEAEINKRIGKAASAMSRLSTRVWENTNLTTNTKIAVYNACVLSTLLYGSETWRAYARQERRLNSFHLRCLRRILASLGRIEYLTRTSLSVRASQACSQCSPRDACAGSATFCSWKTDACRRMYSTAS